MLGERQVVREVVKRTLVRIELANKVSGSAIQFLHPAVRAIQVYPTYRCAIRRNSVSLVLEDIVYLAKDEWLSCFLPGGESLTQSVEFCAGVGKNDVVYQDTGCSEVTDDIIGEVLLRYVFAAARRPLKSVLGVDEHQDVFSFPY